MLEVMMTMVERFIRLFLLPIAGVLLLLSVERFSYPPSRIVLDKSECGTANTVATCAVSRTERAGRNSTGPIAASIAFIGTVGILALVRRRCD